MGIQHRFYEFSPGYWNFWNHLCSFKEGLLHTLLRHFNVSGYRPSYSTICIPLLALSLSCSRSLIFFLRKIWLLGARRVPTLTGTYLILSLTRQCTRGSRILLCCRD